MNHSLLHPRLRRSVSRRVTGALAVLVACSGILAPAAQAEESTTAAPSGAVKGIPRSTARGAIETNGVEGPIAYSLAQAKWNEYYAGYQPLIPQGANKVDKGRLPARHAGSCQLRHRTRGAAVTA